MGVGYEQDRQRSEEGRGSTGAKGESGFGRYRRPRIIQQMEGHRRDLGERGKEGGVIVSKLDRDCWIHVVKNAENGGYRYRLDMKDGETEKKLTYTGDLVKGTKSRWAGEERREDKYGQ